MKHKYFDVTQFDIPDYRQDQFNTAVFKQLVPSIDDFTTWSDDLKQKVKRNLKFPSIKKIDSFKTDKTLKVLFECQDGNTFESVLLIHGDNRNTVCASTQVGCPMACKFCATGKMGFTRDLDYREIVDQILYFARLLNDKHEKVTNVVYMGMGEPMLNLENVMKSAAILTDEDQFKFGSRRITLSTVGIIEPMKKFFKNFHQINLAISLHSANQEIREKIMPRASKTSLSELTDYIKFHITQYNRRISLEYILIKDVNDQSEDVNKLHDLFNEVGKDARKLIHINLIRLNPTGSKLEPTPEKQVLEFRDMLTSRGINTTIRESMGVEVEAACGMLKTKKT